MFSSLIIPLTNFGNDGPAALGNYQGMSSNGVFDMAGNVMVAVKNKDNRRNPSVNA